MAGLTLLPPPIMPTDSPLEVRELTPQEILTLAPIFKDSGTELPPPNISTFIGAVEDGKVIGFLVLQLKLHAEPMWIEEGRSELFKSLINKARGTILAKAGPQWVYTFTPAGRISQMAQSMGMQMEPWIVHSMLVMPEVPPKSIQTLETLPQSEAEEYVI